MTEEEALAKEFLNLMFEKIGEFEKEPLDQIAVAYATIANMFLNLILIYTNHFRIAEKDAIKLFDKCIKHLRDTFNEKFHNNYIKLIKEEAEELKNEMP